MTVEEMVKRREELGISYEKLSKQSGVPMITIQKIFNGKTKNPRKVTMIALEKAFGESKSEQMGKLFEYQVKSSGNLTLHEDRAYYIDDTKGPYTVEDYYSVPEEKRVELIDGYFYDMASPSFMHQEILGFFFLSVSMFIKENKGKCKALLSPLDVKLDYDDKTIVQPDMIILCDKNKSAFFRVEGAPDFALEILSPSSRKKDMVIKLEKYEKAGVREYWIIDPKNKKLITYNFMDENFLPEVMKLEGQAGLAIYDGKLKISLDEIREIIEAYDEE